MSVVGMGLLVLMFSAAFGFYQTYHWNMVTLIFAMAAMVPGACLVTDRLLYPATRQRFEENQKFPLIFLGVVSVLAYLAFINGKSDFRRSDNAVTHYAALWWLIFPYCCAGLLALDRLFNRFKGRPSEWFERVPEEQVDWRRVYEEKFGPYKEEKEELSQAENIIPFDPKRFH